MASINSPFFDINYGWVLGANGWNTGMDQNLLVISFLLKGSVNGFTNTLPAAASTGESYILNSDKKAYFKVGNSWVFVTPVEGWEFNTLSDSKRWKFVSNNYVEIPTTSQLSTQLGSTSDNIGNLADQVQTNTQDIGTLAQNLGDIVQNGGVISVTSDGNTKQLSDWMLFVLDRENHTGTQLSETISDLEEKIEDTVFNSLTSDGSVVVEYDDTNNLIYVNSRYHKATRITLTNNTLDLTGYTGGAVIVELDRDITNVIPPIGILAVNATLDILFRQDSVGGHTVSGWSLVDWQGHGEPSVNPESGSQTLVKLSNADTFGWVGSQTDYAIESKYSKPINTIEISDPTVDDDETKGYSVFSLWKGVNDEVFICVDASEGAAVWKQITI